MGSETPRYYIGKYKKIEAFDVCMDFAADSYNVGVAIAYLLRAGKKPGNSKINDLYKAIQHIEKEMEYLQMYGQGGEGPNDKDLEIMSETYGQVYHGDPVKYEVK
jgi:hypothetical protein